MGTATTPLPHPKLDWVLVANASRARLFERDPDNGAMRELADYVDVPARLRESEGGADRPGRAMKGMASTSFAPRTPAHDRAARQFAQALARELEAAALDGRMPSLALVASPRFLGRLRAALGPAATARLGSHAALDLSTLQGAALERRVGDALRTAAPAEPAA